MSKPYTDHELNELVTELKAWISHPIKELIKQTNLSRVTVSNWYNNRGNIKADNRMLLWKASKKLILEKQQTWGSDNLNSLSKNQSNNV